MSYLKRSFWLCLFGLCCFGLVGQQAEQVLESTTSVEHSMSSKSLQPEQLKGFDLRAQQKVQDFVELLNFIGNPAVDKALRQEVLKNALKLFETENVLVQLPLPTPSQENQVSVSAYLNKLLESTQTQHFELIELQSNPPYFPTTPESRWVITFSLKTEWTDTPTSSSRYQAEAILKKRNKHFGQETREVWEVVLGRISVVP